MTEDIYNSELLKVKDYLIIKWMIYILKEVYIIFWVCTCLLYV